MTTVDEAVDETVGVAEQGDVDREERAEEKQGPFTIWLNQRLQELDPELTNLAARAGISNAYLSMLKSGQRARPSRDVVDALATALGSSLEEAREAAGLPLLASPNRPSTSRIGSLLQPPGAAYDRNWYIMRPNQEARAFSNLHSPGSPALLWGPVHFGKTWLLRRVVSFVSDQGYQVAQVNLRTDLEPGTLDSLESFLSDWARRILESVELELEMGASKSAGWSLTPGAGAPVHQFSQFIEQRILGQCRGFVALAIDQVDELWTAPYRDEVFGMLRYWAESGQRKPWNRLRLIFTSSMHPVSLVQTDDPSPFNIGPPIILEDLENTEVQLLSRYYRLIWDDQTVSTLTRSVGGHPYLVRLAMWSTATGGSPLSQLNSAADLEQSVFAPHLAGRLRWIKQRKPLEEAVRQILEGDSSGLDMDAYFELQSAGLVRQEGDSVRLRYPIYTTYFGSRL